MSPHNSITPPHSLKNVTLLTDAHTPLATRGILRSRWLFCLQPPLLQEKVTFPSLIGSHNSAAGVPQRSRASRPEVATLNREGKSQVERHTKRVAESGGWKWIKRTLECAWHAGQLRVHVQERRAEPSGVIYSCEELQSFQGSRWDF